MTDQPSASAAAQHISAASEERFIARTEELVKESSRATVFATMTLQALLVACVVLWVLDVPRKVFNLSFYTEQLLAVTLGPDAGARLHHRNVPQAQALRSGGRNRLGRHRRLPDLQLSPGRRDCLARRRGPCRGAGLDLCGGAARRRALARLGLHGGLARALRLHHRPLRGADLRTGDAAARRRGRQRDPDVPGAGGEPPHLRLGLRQHHPGDRGLRLHQPVSARRLPDPLGHPRAHGRLSSAST